MNPVTVTIINLQKEYWLILGSNQRPPHLKSCMLRAELQWIFYLCSKSTDLTHYQTTNFRLFRIERLCRRQIQIWQEWQKVIQASRMHCGKRRNCSLRAISPFPSVLKRLVSQGCQKVSLCGNGLTIHSDSVGQDRSAQNVQSDLDLQYIVDSSARYFKSIEIEICGSYVVPLNIHTL